MIVPLFWILEREGNGGKISEKERGKWMGFIKRIKAGQGGVN